MLSIISLQIFCSSVNLFNWLQNHLIPCPLKALTGFDCPGCGFQRAFILLVQGDFANSWSLYPPTVPILCLFICSGISYILSIKNRSAVINIAAIIVGNFVLLSYFYKLFMR